MVFDILQKAGSCTLEYLIPFFKAGIIMIMRLPKEVDDLVEERKKILDRIRKAVDRVAAAEDGDERDQMKKKAMKLRIIDFRMEDVIDEWNSCLQHERMNERKSMKAIVQNMSYEEWEHSDNGCVALPCESANKFVSIRGYDRLQIALKIKKIKSDLDEIKDLEQEDPIADQEEKEEREKKEKNQNSRKNPDKEWKKLEQKTYKAPTEILGLEEDSRKIIDWLEDGSPECNVMVLVGMAGQGKTTLAKKIYDNNEVIEKFKYSAWINVSDFSDPKEFFKFMLVEFYKEPKTPPYGYITMGLESLKNEVKKYLRTKRYILFFDDVWNENFWQDIEQTVSDSNENGSRIIITTRNKEVAMSCENHTIVVQPLSKTVSEKMFCQIAFKGNLCPKKYANESSEIVKICDGLPLGIAAIGKLVSRRREVISEWKTKLRATGVAKRFSLAYDNLPNHLKPCLLYFGIYPKGYVVKAKRLTRQWIAEGFVKYDIEKSVEKVAEGYLTSLIDRNLVQVSSFDGKRTNCGVHYLVHDMILKKFEDLSFCYCINEEYQWGTTDVTPRHLSIAVDSTEKIHELLNCLADADIKCSFIRSLHFFPNEESPKQLETKIPSKFERLKVLDFENSQLSLNLEKLGNLIHLKYLSFRGTKIHSLPKSIDKLVNLETLDVRQTAVTEMPKEVGRLKKLRHILGLVHLIIGIRDMKSLQTLRNVKLDDNVGLIENELRMCWQIKDLGFSNVEKKHGSALCSAIKYMKSLVKLHIAAKSENEVIDIELEKCVKIQKLCLHVKLLKLPECIPDLSRLSKLVISGSKLTNEYDPLKSLKDLPKLLFLSIINEAYVGESLSFEDKKFEGLEELVLGSLYGLSSITAHSTALPSLKKLWLSDIPQLKTLPFSIQHLKNLEHLNYQNMSTEFKSSIAPHGGQECKPDHRACAPCRNKWSAKFVNEGLEAN